MTYQYLLLEKTDHVATVTVNRPNAMNALSRDLLAEIRRCFAELSGDNEVRAVIVTGAGEKAFIAGADIAAMSRMTPAEASEFGQLGHAAMNAIDRCPQPVIAAVNGFCLGGGLELALSCDFIYASETARIGLPEVGLGLFPGWGGTQRLPRLIGKGRGSEVIFTGRMLSAREAHEFGIVNRVCKPEELMTVARVTAAEIAKKGPIAVSLAKKVIHEGCDLPLAQGLSRELETFPKCFETEDLREGLTAFLEKRPAKFRGR